LTGEKTKLAKKAAKTQKTTIVAVAEYAGVSLATASNALSGRRPVDERTRKRVEDAARALGYRPNIGARRMRMGGSETIAIFSSTPLAIAGGTSRLGFMMEIAEAAAVTAIEHGVAMMLVPPAERHLLQINTLQIDGAILLEPMEDDPYLEALRRRQVPVVSIGRPASADVPFIDLQPRATATLILDHLHEVGATHIALITGAAARHSHVEIANTYRQLCDRQEMSPILHRLEETEGEEGAFLAARMLLARHPEIDAIFASVDTFATGVVRAALEEGRSIPENLKIATRYDGVRALTSNPPLTSVRLHLALAAERAVRLLIGAMNGTDGGSPPEPLPSPELVVRGSTASSTQNKKAHCGA
jgi:DNA-binding LacI/PurR family transcriptional regulator